MNAFQNPPVFLLALAGLGCFALAGLESGDGLGATWGGIKASERERGNGEDQASENGPIDLPHDVGKGKEEKPSGSDEVILTGR
ncbi:hypothetical protein [Luteolibacter luteus]|uniref:Secreted protein n=1 Tax=Luteolibacter luteus TaxID=2728835 RepID=A0A858RPK0_9BACT|nr:hypothetical protein [Luteolibacter luteus]QJE98318.1 hypothetical protein HHL09_21885 [Luteolibacter luteus]